MLLEPDWWYTKLVKRYLAANDQTLSHSLPGGFLFVILLVQARVGRSWMRQIELPITVPALHRQPVRLRGKASAACICTLNVQSMYKLYVNSP